MKSANEVIKRIQSINSRIQDLEDQREHNAAEGNWQIVKAFKESIAMLGKEKRILESVLDPEDFMPDEN